MIEQDKDEVKAHIALAKSLLIDMMSNSEPITKDVDSLRGAMVALTLAVEKIFKDNNAGG